MKPSHFSLLIILSISLTATAQQTRFNRLVIPQESFKSKALIHVVTENKDTATRVDRSANFRLNPGEKKATLKTGDILSRIRVPFAGETRADTGKERVFMLPEVYYARVKGSEEQISYRILFIDTAPLKYNFDKGIFESSITFLPREVNVGNGENAVKKTLSEPEEIFVSIHSQKTRISLNSVNWPPVDFPVALADPLDSVEVKVLTISNPTGYSAKLHVEPAIVLSSARQSINGYGVQTIPLNITLKGVSSSADIPVSIEATKGSLTPGSVVLIGDKSQTVNFRSEGIGLIEIKVVNTNYRLSPPIHLQSEVPYLFLFCSVAGGFIGALARRLKGRKKITFRPLAYGTLFGCIVSLAYWGVGILLINIPFTFPVFNEAAVLVLSMLAGLLEWDDLSKLLVRKPV